MLWQVKKEIPLCVLSAALLILSYPIFNFEILAWFAFVPLFFVLQDKTKGQAFLLSFLTGVLFWAGTIYWMHHVSWPGFILLVLYLSLYFGFFGIFFMPAASNQWLAAFLVPVAWVFFEFLRSSGPTGFGWALLGYSQYLSLPVIQIADITGVWGVSFLVMMVNVAVYTVIRNNGNNVKVLLLPIALFMFSLGYGFYKLNYSSSAAQYSPMRVSVIQGNVPQYQKFDENYKDSILGRYKMLTKEAAKDKPDLIIWPESSAPGVIGAEPELLRKILTLARSVNTPILIGAVTVRPPDSDLHAPDCYNSAILISRKGKVLKQYDKLHLVPFGV